MVEQYLTRGEEFFVDRLSTGNLFKMVERADYSYLYCIKRLQEEQGNDRVYFAQIAEHMNQSIPSVSKAMNHLKSEGYLIWKVDGDSERTYVQLKESTLALIEEQRRKLIEAFKELEAEVGEEELKAAMHVMQRIRAIGNHVYEKNTEANA